MKRELQCQNIVYVVQKVALIPEKNLILIKY